MFSRETFQKAAKISFFLFIISMFLPLRHVFFSNSAYQTGAYSDFTSFSLYLSDLLLLTTWCCLFLPRGGELKSFYHVVRKPVILIFWLILGLIIHFQDYKSLNLYFFFKYAELLVAYGTTVIMLGKISNKQQLAWLFASLGSLESILGLVQFWLQRSVGLKWLGENLIGPSISGVAKIVSSGTVYIRSYGTFPHPNLLSAFLAISAVISLYLLLSAPKKFGQVFATCLLVLNLFGLTVTFSRAGYLAGLGGLGALLIFLILKKTQGLRLPVLAITLTIISCLLIFWPWLSTRATITDNSTLERMKYNEAGLKMVQTHPVFGVGIGESVLHMEQFLNQRLQPWEKQPVHNYFLLSAAELGLPGMLILLWLFWRDVPAAIRLAKQGSLLGMLLLSLYFAIFVLMQFDHYFYTLEQTQLLLWVFLGAAALATKPPAQASAN